MKFESSISISASPETVFTIYSDAPHWSAWDLEVESASFDGDFRLGAEGRIKPKGAPNSKMKITELTPNQSFTIECGLPLCKMHFIHILHVMGAETKVVNYLEFTGLLAPLMGRLIGKSISKTMPQSLAGLKQYAEVR